MTPADLRSRRLAMGLTQARLAEHLGVSTKQVNAWERGRAGLPSLLELAMTALEASGEHRRRPDPARASSGP